MYFKYKFKNSTPYFMILNLKDTLKMFKLFEKPLQFTI